MSSETLPELPAPLGNLVRHIAEHPDTPMVQLMKPYRDYEAHLRQAFAQNPDHELLKDHHVNILPLFTDDTPSIKVRARDITNESAEESSKYVMPLPKDLRRPDKSPAVVQSFKDFQRNFNVFSESSLIDLDWNNIVAAGSSVVNCLLPVPEHYNRSKRGLRDFFHEKFSPASDVDLFMYGLTEEQAIEKIKDIEARVRDSLLTETTIVRTKHAVTICSQYPTRHIQIVLRIYKSVSEILTGFDIDCSGAAYDGKQVYCTPRALQSYITQTNHIDLSRRSSSYENRFSKYSHRGFEVYWSELDRSRIDPTIFERSFRRTVGLARLLVLEQLPTPSARDSYLNQRREERGRPRINRYLLNLHTLNGNIKDEHEDEIADWVNEEEVSKYHTFSIPYGPRFHAKRIEKLCYTRDLLLNAEWNQHDDNRKKEVAEKEDKIYVSGTITFLKDDPGRQAIVDGDVEHVEDWIAQEGANLDARDYTGRTPLHLAVMCSSPEVVRCLVNAGARLVSRLADGRTALHLAAARGDGEIIKILMEKSAANEGEYEEKEDQRRRSKSATEDQKAEGQEDTEDNASSDGELVEEDESDNEAKIMATGSFVRVESKTMPPDELVPVEDKEEPNFYDVNVVAWDTPCSALHFAIMEGQVEAVKALCQGLIAVFKEHGADALLPVKFLDNEKRPSGALLTLVLALALPVEEAVEMAETLLSLGVSSAQADMNSITAFHRYAEQNAESLLDALVNIDTIGTKTAINHIAFPDSHNSSTPLHAALRSGNLGVVLKLFDNGAVPQVDFESWLKSAKLFTKMEQHLSGFEVNQKRFNQTMEQPLLVALKSPNPAAALVLLERGADPNAITPSSHSYLGGSMYSRFEPESALDIVKSQLMALREYLGEVQTLSRPSLPKGIDTYLDNFKDGTYQHWLVSVAIDEARKSYRKQIKTYEKEEERLSNSPGVLEKKTAIAEAIHTMEEVRQAMLERDAKTFMELHPEYVDRFAHLSYQNAMKIAQAQKPFDVNFIFSGVSDMTEARKVAYVQLFEAAWAGDLERIKTFTLTTWDEYKIEAPLKIAVYSQNQGSHTPFSLAFFRGHLNVAKAILEITQAQYSPDEKRKTRLRMEQDDDCGDDESVGSNDSEPRLYSEIVDNEFTIENVGQVSMKVKSDVKPQDFLNWYCIEVGKDAKLSPRTRTMFYHIIQRNDINGLRILLDWAEYFTTSKFSPDDEVLRFYSFPDDDFRIAVELGRTEILAGIIRRTGAGLPLEQLVKNSGVELTEIPVYYQGLTVKEWASTASAGRDAVYSPTGSETSPLLIGAEAGRIETVEWFLTDIPSRHYLDFAKSKAARDDKRLKHLAQSPGGVDGAISKWLSNQSDLVIHAAVCCPENEKTIELVSYLVETCASSLDKKSGEGTTPLMVACHNGRVEFAKILIEAGADQITRDISARNLLHAALYWNPTAKQLKPLLDLFDRSVLAHMLQERSRTQTPIQFWLAARHTSCFPNRYDNTKDELEVLKLLLNIAPEVAAKALTVLNGAGDTPLHFLTQKDAGPVLVRTIIDFSPSLLLRVNAVGRTPVEVAHDRFVSSRIKEEFAKPYHSINKTLELVSRAPATFLEKEDDNGTREHEEKSNVAKNWRLCTEMLGRLGSTKRRLVSLSEANDVAKRLSKEHTRKRYNYTLATPEEGSEGAEEGKWGGQSRRTVDFVLRKMDLLSTGFWEEPKTADRNVEGGDDTDEEES
ncbi:hypothetical protein B0T26DRAFT_669889 [Lasiosphaeria miniovina]|uniref:Ankyrin repeat protein n=1 Tax=Lasiosphaeria miniovina TaxID=1954250 RepID=A0AA40BFV5_9PEZI|nr:uncharacterized protein B0T26DRAFT_669889 [Lasiosphaeria miniovina]KAK0733485.1 hypothetical protein B0T26DRAFT_669889 [Lasiosphaeria miniovina]